MFLKDRKTRCIQASAGVIPLILSLICVLKEIWILLLFCVAALFAIVGLVPLFKRRESIWMFVFVAAAACPVNIKLTCWFIIEGPGFVGAWYGDIFLGLLMCGVLMSVEEIVFGVITRLIWKRQYKLGL